MILNVREMKKVLIITDIQFWMQGAGNSMRVLRLVEYLSENTSLTIAYIGLYPSKSEVLPDENLRVVFLNKTRAVSPAKNGRLLKQFLDEEHFDVIIVEYIHNAYYLSYINQPVIKILDAHDIVSERSESFRQFKYPDISYELSEEIELKVFEYFDFIMLLCQRDCETVDQHLGRCISLLCPHPPRVSAREIKTEVKKIGFIASQFIPNKDALDYFIAGCWPAISNTYDVSLNIYGQICRLVSADTSIKNINLKGFVASLDQAYEELDLIINPVRFGAGVKIKNLEALANGLPLVTTTHGSRGIEEQVGTSFFVGNTPGEIINCLSQLIENYSIRKEMSRKAIEFISEKYTPSKCFKGLMEIIENS